MSNIEDEMASNANETGTRATSGKITYAEQSVQKYLNLFVEKLPHPAKKDEIGNSSCSFDRCELDHALPEGGTRASFDRVVCCNTSRSIYCKDCCRLLVPDHFLPIPISRRRRTIIGDTTNLHKGMHPEGRPLRLPFNLHIILDDRRGSSTGVHAMALLNGKHEKGSVNKHHGKDKDDSGTDYIAVKKTSNDFSDLGSVTLIDLPNDDEIPNYQLDNASTFLLLPSEGESVPLESVAQQIQTLVVLDIKWTKSRVWGRNKSLSTLQKVHLSSPPQQSYYWCWHNAGHGMTSTIEAIYYATFEASQAKHRHLLESGQISQSDSDNLLIDQENLVHLLWLFGHQRAATFKRAQNEGKPAPCSDEGKALIRATRKQKGTWRQLRHEEDERLLKEKHGLKEERKKPPV